MVRLGRPSSPLMTISGDFEAIRRHNIDGLNARMKKSATVTLTIVAAMGLAARTQSRRDPCEAATFNEHACQQAIQAGGLLLERQMGAVEISLPIPVLLRLVSRAHLAGRRGDC